MPEEDSRRGVVEPRWVKDPRAAAPSARRRFDIVGAAAALSLGFAGDRLGMREWTCVHAVPCEIPQHLSLQRFHRWLLFLPPKKPHQ